MLHYQLIVQNLVSLNPADQDANASQMNSCVLNEDNNASIASLPLLVSVEIIQPSL